MGDNLLHKVLADHPSKFGFITHHAPDFRFQALLSEVKIDPSTGRPFLVRHGYRVDNEYFYPASAIKLCAAVAALYKLQHLQKTLGLDVTCMTPLAFYPLREDEEIAVHDPSNIATGNITIAHEIRKLFLVSDNVAFNRLYAFAGQHYLNKTMWQLGLKSTRLQHRLSELISTEDNRFCEPVGIYLEGTSVTLPPKKNEFMQPISKGLEGMKVGRAHVLMDGDLVSEPIDFSEKNYMSLFDLQNLLVKILCKDIKLDGEAMELFHGFEMMLMDAMSEYPSNSCNPVYAESEFPDDYGKLFLPGLCRVRPKKSLRVFSKLGRAYGFTIENAYIFDKERAQGFFLSAVIYTNSNGILNDDKYEYEEIADHVMADLAEMVARAVWKIPTFLKVSSFDCIPSSTWKELQRRRCDSNVSDDDTKDAPSIGPSMVENMIEISGKQPGEQSFSLLGWGGLYNFTYDLMKQQRIQSLLSLHGALCRLQIETVDTQMSSPSVCCTQESDKCFCTKQEKAFVATGFSPPNECWKVPFSPKSKSSFRIASSYKYYLNE